jgi:hypothetical protein
MNSKIFVIPSNPHATGAAALPPQRHGYKPGHILLMGNPVVLVSQQPFFVSARQPHDGGKDVHWNVPKHLQQQVQDMVGAMMQPFFP